MYTHGKPAKTTPGKRLLLMAGLAFAALALAPTAAQAHWQHGWHGGRLGWWWVDAGLWTWYAGYPYYPYYPYYGYPAPYYAAPVQPAPAYNSNIPAQPQVWYYCDAAQGYYPQVPNCPGGWRPVPSTPPPAAPANP